jgi:hypothetical protein
LTNQEEAAVESGVYSPLRSRDATIFEPPELFNTNKREHQRQQQARQVREHVAKFSFAGAENLPLRHLTDLNQFYLNKKLLEIRTNYVTVGAKMQGCGLRIHSLKYGSGSSFLL